MKNLEKSIIEFIEKYPFFTDPIVLFNPAKQPTEKQILSGKLNLKYPEIDKNRKRLRSLKKDFYTVLEELRNTKFFNLYYKIEYYHRLKDFYRVIRILECFYDDEEYEKYNLINEYFGINYELLDEIFSNKEKLLEEFKPRKAFLKNKQVKKLQETQLDSNEIKFYFEEAIKFLKLENNWKVVVGDAVSIVHTDFNESGGNIIIPENKIITAEKLLELIAHEIDGHCVQFSNCSQLSSGTIRFSKSESLAEGFAMYMEYSFSNFIYGKCNIENSYKKNKNRFLVHNGDLSIEKYINGLDNGGVRFFRGIKNIEKYKNLKDFVYIQGIYKVIKYRKKYNNFFELVKSGAINDSYIKKYGKEEGRKKKIKIKETSAFYVLNKYFIK